MEFHSTYVVIVCACHAITPLAEVYHHEENRTPLHWACNGGCIQVLKYLVEQCKVDVGE